MVIEEKRAWIMVATSLVTYGVYAVIVAGRLRGAPAAEVSYVVPLLWCVGIAVAAQIVLHIAADLAMPRDTRRRDERDREIGLLGEHVGHAFLVLGGLAVLVMAMAEVDHFWIANAMYLAFSLSAILESVAKISAYRLGFRRW